jgi:hypothetical protein
VLLWALALDLVHASSALLHAFRAAAVTAFAFALLPVVTGFSNEWLRLVLDHLGSHLPLVSCVLGTAYTRGPPVAPLRSAFHWTQFYVDGWAVNGKAVHYYVEPTCPASAAARRFVGWLFPA